MKLHVGFFTSSVLCVSLFSCGGGGGGSSSSFGGETNSTGSSNSFNNNSWAKGVFSESSKYAGLCAAPRKGLNPISGAAYTDKSGSLSDEKFFLRSWSNESYLWYSEIYDLNPANFSTPKEYFDILKTVETTASGKLKDSFHFTVDSLDYEKSFQAGQSFGYGMSLKWASGYPRKAEVAYLESGSAAELAGIKRGYLLSKIDGEDFVYSTNVAILNNGLFPTSSGQVHVLEFIDPQTSETKKFSLISGDVTLTPVQNVKTISTTAGKVGYIQFNQHIKSAVQPLQDAFSSFAAQGVNDLVLDLRYNGGGAVYIAAEVAYMIAGKAATDGKVFDRLVGNDKSNSNYDFKFGQNQYGVVENLPALDLKRVYVITTKDTCSASEAIMNGLRGVGVEVIQIGSKTCGKPYGFIPEENCGTTYFSINFKGENAKGFGEYSDGFSPSVTDNGTDAIKGCSTSDDLSKSLGDPTETSLAVALNYRATGSCSLASGSANTLRLEKLSVPEEQGSLQRKEFETIMTFDH